jgi:hypothetical protein
VGLPWGHLTSQLRANWYLDPWTAWSERPAALHRRRRDQLWPGAEADDLPLRLDGRPNGTAFLVDRKHVATALHVLSYRSTVDLVFVE